MMIGQVVSSGHSISSTSGVGSILRVGRMRERSLFSVWVVFLRRMLPPLLTCEPLLIS